MEDLKIDCQKTAERICRFLREEFGQRNKTRAVLGISGGIDSAVVAFLCQRAELDLYPVSLPYGKLANKEGVKKLIEVLNPSQDRFIEIDITEMVDVQLRNIESKIILDKIDKGNIIARQRMVVQYALARRLNGLVVGTENLSEYYLGYFTLHGDQACDINPIGGLFKTQVMELAKFLRVPPGILKQKPSAELYGGQTDEEELGFSYQEADPILYLFCSRELSPEKIIKDSGFKTDLVNKVLKRVEATNYKRKEVPKYGEGN